MLSILEVRDLHVAYSSRAGPAVRALAGVSFSLGEGEVLGVVGESGSGKSSLAATILRMLAPNARSVRGSVHFEGRDLLTATEDELRTIRGARISLVFQEPGLALHPGLRVREQIADVLRAHETVDRRTLREKTDAALCAVFPTDAARIGASYPHELSGGQRQRVVVAQAIVCRPSVLIADEPTASLDPVTQGEILGLFRELQGTIGMALMYITHNPALLVGFARRILVLYAGGVAECGPTDEVLPHPKHPYTKALLECLPGWPAEHSANPRLTVISGDAPDMAASSPGCRFEPRCPARMEACAVREPGATQLGAAHSVRCLKFGG